MLGVERSTIGTSVLLADFPWRHAAGAASGFRLRADLPREDRNQATGGAVWREQRDILREQFYTDADRSTCLTFVKLSIHPSEGENMDVSHETKAAVRPALWGAAAGAIALAIVGFTGAAG